MYERRTAPAAAAMTSGIAEDFGKAVPQHADAAHGDGSHLHHPDLSSLSIAAHRDEDLLDFFMPPHLRAFRNMLERLESIFSYLHDRVAPSSRFKALIYGIWKGDRGNAGLLGAYHRLQKSTLLDTLGVQHDQELAHIDPHQFYHAFIPLRFLPALNQIIRLYLMQRIPEERWDVKTLLTRDGVDQQKVTAAYMLSATVLATHYGIRLRPVSLFEEAYDPSRHNKTYSAYEALKVLSPSAMDAITRLPSGLIYELFDVGLQSDVVGVDKKPTVIYKE